MVLRRSTRKSPRKSNEKTKIDDNINEKSADNSSEPVNHDLSSDEEEDEEHEEQQLYMFEGKSYDSYQEMVNAKRKRNEERLKSSGLLQMVEDVSSNNKRKTNGINAGGLAAKKRKKKDAPPAVPTRQSNRRRGIPADGNYVHDERGGRFEFAGGTAAVAAKEEEEKEKFFKNRINDGSELSTAQAVEACAPKWIQETTVATAQEFVHTTLKSLLSTNAPKDHKNSKTGSKTKRASGNSSPTSVVDKVADNETKDDTDHLLEQQIERLSIEDENMVAKVTPERIYSVAIHPSTSALIVGAGDKQGYVGLWNVNQYHPTNDTTDTKNEDDTDNNKKNDRDGVHLFRVHASVVNSLQWTKQGDALMSASYDGTVRWLDLHTEQFEEVFATYDDDSYYAEELGFGLDEGSNYWTQYCTLADNVNSTNDKCFFLSTNTGMVYHIDRRIGQGGKITFREQLSEKKINSVSLHPNGHVLASSGLDCAVNIWDVRKFGNKNKSKKASKDALIGSYRSRKSINSAFFSPSGSKLVATTMDNKLDIYHNIHLQSNNKKSSSSSKESIYHDNHTGRWLSTFMAQWHPTQDVFVVGSMGRPRGIDIFSAMNDSCELVRTVQGEALGSVASRCCFHPNSRDNLTLIGGNSSGRVTVVKEYK